MSQPERKKAYAIVAFRYDKFNSILYRGKDDIDYICLLVGFALREGADVISIRRVYTEEPIPSTELAGKGD